MAWRAERPLPRVHRANQIKPVQTKYNPTIPDQAPTSWLGLTVLFYVLYCCTYNTVRRSPCAHHVFVPCTPFHFNPIQNHPQGEPAVVRLAPLYRPTQDCHRSSCFTLIYTYMCYPDAAAQGNAALGHTEIALAPHHVGANTAIEMLECMQYHRANVPIFQYPFAYFGLTGLRIDSIGETVFHT